MSGRRTAAQIALASAASFFCRGRNAFTRCAGISRTSWPSFVISRAQWCAVLRQAQDEAASLDPHQAALRRKLGEERGHVLALQVLLHDNMPFGILGMSFGRLRMRQ